MDLRITITNLRVYLKQLNRTVSALETIAEKKLHNVATKKRRNNELRRVDMSGFAVPQTSRTAARRGAEAVRLP